MSSGSEPVKDEEVSEALERATAAANEALRPYEMEATKILASMIVGGIRAGSLPPKDVFEWYAMYMTEMLVHAEKLAMSEAQNEWIEPLLARTVTSVAEVLRICDGNKLLVLKDKIQKTLKARALYLPPDFDMTYEGMLPRY